MVDGEDLGKWMVLRGWAVAYVFDAKGVSGSSLDIAAGKMPAE